MQGLEEKKKQKKDSLLSAAYDLFTEKGVAKTSVDEIVQRAKVAKGTFYLYFHDKTAVMQELVYSISQELLTKAYQEVSAHPGENFTENVILLLDYVIEHFKKNRLKLRLIERNFTWPMVARQLTERKDDPLWEGLRRAVAASDIAQQYTEDELFKLIYIIIEMCGSTCYSSIIENKPDTIDNMKPVLYGMIRKILNTDAA